MRKIIETERLILKEWDYSDIDAAFCIWGDAEVMKYVSKTPLSIEQVKNSLELGMTCQKENGYQIWPVLMKDDLKIIGCCGFNSYDEEEKTLEIVFHFMKEYWGKGYATESVKASIEYGFLVLNVNNIIAAVHPENYASEKVLKKVGMKFIEKRWYDDTKQYELFYAIGKSAHI